MNNQNVNNESTVNRLDAKSGWLFNQENMLCCMKQWKRRWFVLDMNCTLRYFERPDNSVAEGLILLRKPYTLSDSSQMKNIDPPEGCSKDGLLKIETPDDKLTLCSVNPDEMREWRNILESIRGVCTTPAPVYHEVIMTPVIFLQPMTMPTYVIQSTDQQTTAVDRMSGHNVTSRIPANQSSTCRPRNGRSDRSS